MEKVYKSFMLTGNTLIIITQQGDPLIKVPATAEDIAILKELQTEEDLYNFVIHPDFVKEANARKEQQRIMQQQAEEIRNKFAILEESGWFDIKEDTVYFKGINRSLSALLVEHFARVFKKRKEAFEENNEEDFNRYDAILLALKRFQLWAFANPRAEVADELYGFLKNNVMRITKQGLIVALRNVVTVEGIDTTLVRFVSESFNKMKAAFWLWRKNPINYDVWESVDRPQKEYKLVRNDAPEYLDLNLSSEFSYEFVGNLAQMYHNLPNLQENRYTDAHTRTFDIRIGQKVWMDPKKCSWSIVDCGEAGLKYVASL